MLSAASRGSHARYIICIIRIRKKVCSYLIFSVGYLGKVPLNMVFTYSKLSQKALLTEMKTITSPKYYYYFQTVIYIRIIIIDLFLNSFRTW